MERKKAQIGYEAIPQILIIFLIAGIVLGAGALILSKVSTTVQTTNSYSVTEELRFLSHFPNQTTQGGNSSYVAGSLASVTVYNASIVNAYILVTDGNYTIDTTTGSINLTTESSYTLLNASINYTWTGNNNPTEFYAIKNASGGLINISNFMPTIEIIVEAIIILGLIFAGFRFKNE